MRNALNILANLTKAARQSKARKGGAPHREHYFAVHVAWLDCPEHGRTQRLALIQRAARKEPDALRALDAVTQAWEAKHGKRTRFGSIQLSHLDSVGNGTSDVFGNKRVAWQRFAVWVALRALTSSPKFQATRASIRQIAALANGFPTIAAATADGLTIETNHAEYRRTQRAIGAFMRANMVLSFRTKGYRTAWYSYRLSTPEMPRAIALEQAEQKRTVRVVRELIADIETHATKRLTNEDAAAIYDEVKPHGWHDVDLLSPEMRQAIAGNVKFTRTMAGRTYVRLTKSSAAELEREHRALIATVGRHVMRC